MKHFNEEIKKDLPDEYPAKCPLCDHVSGNRTNMALHYGITHKVVVTCIENALKNKLQQTEVKQEPKLSDVEATKSQSSGLESSTSQNVSVSSTATPGLPNSEPSTATPGPVEQSDGSLVGDVPLPYKCRMCPLMVSHSQRSDHLCMHFKEKLLEDLPTEAPLSCPLCNYVGIDLDNLVRHYGGHHGLAFKYLREYLEALDEDVSGLPNVQDVEPGNTEASKDNKEAVLGVQCRLCDTLPMLGSNTEFNKHLLEVHFAEQVLGEMPNSMPESIESTPSKFLFRCNMPNCDYTAPSRNRLFFHIGIQHRIVHKYYFQVMAIADNWQVAPKYNGISQRGRLPLSNLSQPVPDQPQEPVTQPCIICKVEVPKETMLFHFAEVHFAEKVEKLPKKVPFKCTICEHHSPDYKNLLRHFGYFHKEFRSSGETEPTTQVKSEPGEDELLDSIKEESMDIDLEHQGLDHEMQEVKDEPMDDTFDESQALDSSFGGNSSKNLSPIKCLMCDDCREISPNKTEFWKHLTEIHFKQALLDEVETVDTEPKRMFRCPVCAYENMYKYHVAKHIGVKHRYSRDYYNAYCGIKDEETGEMAVLAPATEKVQMYECKICQIKSRGQHEYLKHLSKQHFKHKLMESIPRGSDPRCPYPGCDFDKKDRPTIAIHIGTFHKVALEIMDSLPPDANYQEVEAKCKLCSESFTAHRYLFTHLSESHFQTELDAQIPKDPPWKCPKCSYLGSDPKALRTHFGVRHKMVLNHYASKLGMKLSTLQTQMREGRRQAVAIKPISFATITCKYCSLKFKDESEKAKHVILHFRKMLITKLPPEAPFKCPLCEHVSDTQFNLLLHYGLCHPEVMQELMLRAPAELDLENTVGPSTVCSSRQSNYIPAHRAQVDDKKFPKCKICNYRYFTRLDLCRHFVDFHLRDKLKEVLSKNAEGKCPACPRVFKEHQALSRHFVWCHQDLEKMVFVDNQVRLSEFLPSTRDLDVVKLKNDNKIRLESGQEELRLDFKDITDLAALPIYTSIDIKCSIPSCELCGEEFSTSVNKARDKGVHLLSHFRDDIMKDIPNKKPFNCPTCTFVGKDIMDLVRHYGLSHRAVFKSMAKELGEEWKLDEGGDFMCKVCDQVMLNTRTLNDHYCSQHFYNDLAKDCPKEAPFKCHKCNFEGKSAILLVRHMANKHKMLKSLIKEHELKRKKRLAQEKADKEDQEKKQKEQEKAEKSRQKEHYNASQYGQQKLTNSRSNPWNQYNAQYPPDQQHNQHPGNPGQQQQHEGYPQNYPRGPHPGQHPQQLGGPPAEVPLRPNQPMQAGMPPHHAQGYPQQQHLNPQQQYQHHPPQQGMHPQQHRMPHPGNHVNRHPSQMHPDAYHQNPQVRQQVPHQHQHQQQHYQQSPQYHQGQRFFNSPPHDQQQVQYSPQGGPPHPQQQHSPAHQMMSPHHAQNTDYAHQQPPQPQPGHYQQQPQGMSSSGSVPQPPQQKATPPPTVPPPPPPPPKQTKAQKQEQVPLACPMCSGNSTFLSSVHFIRHAADKHFFDQLKEELPKAPPFKCPVCSHEAKDIKLLVRHYGIKHHMVVRLLNERNGKPGSYDQAILKQFETSDKNRESCPMCKSHFAGRYMLLRHLADCHYRERLCQGLQQGDTYKCPACTHESKDKGGFVRHYGLVHKMVQKWLKEDGLGGALTDDRVDLVSPSSAGEGDYSNPASSPYSSTFSPRSQTQAIPSPQHGYESPHSESTSYLKCVIAKELVAAKFRPRPARRKPLC